MNDKARFLEKLNGLLALAKDQESRITIEEVKAYFSEDALTEEQMELVFDYLLAQKISVTGYVKMDIGETEKPVKKNKEEKAKIKKAQNQLQKLEKEAEKLCEEIENIDKELVDPAKASDYEGLNELYKNKVELNEKLDEILLTLDSLRDILGE